LKSFLVISSLAKESENSYNFFDKAYHNRLTKNKNRRVKGILELAYLLASILYLIGSVILYFPNYSLISTILFIIASVLFLGGGIKDIIDKIILHTILYLLGGLLFTIGSFLFLEVNIIEYGVWCFRLGSCCYIIGGGCNIYILVKGNEPCIELNSKLKLKIVSIVDYMFGSSFFIMGGILYELKVTYIALATLRTIGALFFTIGALILFILTIW
jgi:hypothetical protein